MGTPAIITFTSKNGIGVSTFSMYRHYDGDPVTQFQAFAESLEAAEVCLNEARAEHPLTFTLKAEIAGGFFIGNTTDAFGMAARPISDGGEFYGEYNYLVDLEAMTIELSDDDGNTISPYAYIDRLVEECQDDHRKALDTARESLEGLGFKVL